MKRILLFCLLVLTFGVTPQVHAQLSISVPGQGYTVDFDNDVPGVNQGAFSSALDSNMFSMATGRLNPNAWTYVKDGAIDTLPAVYPGTGNANFATLTVPGGAATLVGWGAWDLNGNHAFAMLPSGTNGTPGMITLKCVNNTGSAITQLSVDYTSAAYNDQPRSNKVSFLYSTDNIVYVRNPSLDFLSTAVATNTWEDGFRTTTISGLNIPNGTNFYLRWYYADASGSGSRDEFSLDMISIVAQTGGATQADALAIASVNGGNALSVDETFNLVVQSVANGVPTPVSADTYVSLGFLNGSGVLGGTAGGTILAGTSSVTITGVTYSSVETGLVLVATASGLTDGQSAPLTVLPKANKLKFVNFPVSGQVGITLSTFTIEARRPDQTVDMNYHGNAEIAIYSGNGALNGTINRPFSNGVASFNDITIAPAGNYRLLVTSGSLIPDTSSQINIIPGYTMTELVVPQYMGSKTAAALNNARTPIAFCLQFNTLTPNTTYDVKLTLALTSEAATGYGAGNVWNGTAFSQNIAPAAFTTDANGNSGPVWYFMQPTGNASRFDAGQVHNLRVGVIPAGGIMPGSPTFVGTKTITALDIATVARTVPTTDDGAFIKGKASKSMSGKYVLIYDNEAGTGNPLYAYTIRQSVPTVTFANTELPGMIDTLWRQLMPSDTGDWAAVIPIGANNPNGVRRIEARNADNSIAGFQTDSDGIWPSGANTTNPIRRQVVILDPNDAPLSKSLTGVVTYANTFNTSMDSTTVFLKDQLGNIIYQTTTDAGGNYSFSGVSAGTYTVSANCSKTWGGASAVDGLAILKHFVGMGAPLAGINKIAADVTHDTPSIINAVDGLFVSKRFVQLITTFPSGDWAFETYSVTLGGAPVIQNIKALCFGDVNGSYIPYH